MSAAERKLDSVLIDRESFTLTRLWLKASIAPLGKRWVNTIHWFGKTTGGCKNTGGRIANPSYNIASRIDFQLLVA